MEVLKKARRRFSIFSTIMKILIASIPLISQLNAECKRCTKMEEAREKEKSKNPQLQGYYEDYLKLQKAAKKSKMKRGRQVREEDRSVQFLAEAGSPSAYQMRDDRDFYEGGRGRNPDFVEYSRRNSSQEARERSSLTSTSPTYSAIFTIFKTKDFLETLDGAFTLFIPTNDAVHRLSPDFFRDLVGPENQEKLAELISNHVVANKILKKDFENYSDGHLKAISGKNLIIKQEGGKWTVNGAQILRSEPAGYDGVIYVIDRVFLNM